MKSMTGYGRGDCSQDGFKITVELSSVNRKQTEISVNLPREMEMLEAQIRDVINRYVARGRLTRSEEHTSELQSQSNLVCRLLLEKKKKKKVTTTSFLHIHTSRNNRKYTC